ncbi:phosphoribosyl transferase domain containing 1 (predicted), isoform CRA_a [Rattus norvegicus]|uniref:Phosphoribosyl transferase domain containing 1 (Predicted), isoform CRA_a n=1 Tax=Rattus norvegicus TaxID=10116 RepID=A6JMB8_RAT|nr:phosphoribosyl transferase domain containing 1 (predicted), isoform CRA_a [Rattus norvegicus]
MMEQNSSVSFTDRAILLPCSQEATVEVCLLSRLHPVRYKRLFLEASSLFSEIRM